MHKRVPSHPTAEYMFQGIPLTRRGFESSTVELSLTNEVLNPMATADCKPERKNKSAHWLINKCQMGFEHSSYQFYKKKNSLVSKYFKKLSTYATKY